MCASFIGDLLLLECCILSWSTVVLLFKAGGGGGVAVLLAVFQLGLTLQQLCTAESIAALSSASYLEVL